MAKEKESVTGRDGYILCKALAYAINVIERLPETRQEWSDCQDMKLILATLNPTLAKIGTRSAQEHLDGGLGEMMGRPIPNPTVSEVGRA